MAPYYAGTERMTRSYCEAWLDGIDWVDLFDSYAAMVSAKEIIHRLMKCPLDLGFGIMPPDLSRPLILLDLINK